MYQLRNEELEIEISALGAELKSLKDCKTKREYLWQADEHYWGRTSPILFPLVGNYKNKEIHHQGKSYPMSQHGFARDMSFSVLMQRDDSIWFSLSATTKTRKIYPFLFRLEIGYRLEGRCVTVIWRVLNQDREPMYFSIGGHPAFNCPMEGHIAQQDCYLKFDVKDKIVSRRINEVGLAVDQFDTYPLADGFLPIKEGLFDHDALVIEGQAQRVALTGPDKQEYVAVSFDAPLFGLWSPAGKRAPFVCVEPWYGRCDHNDFSGELSEREWGNTLETGGEFLAEYKIEV